MLIAWMTTGPLGMMAARFLKGTATGTKMLGRDLWFMVSVLRGTLLLLFFSSSQNVSAHFCLSKSKNLT